jgi:hypothetical protein
LGLEELWLLEVGQEDLIQVPKLHCRQLRKHHISEALSSVFDAEPAYVDHRLEQARPVELIQPRLLVHEELKEDAALLGGHIPGDVLLDELEAEDREAWAGCRLGDEVQEDFDQVDPEVIV